MHPDLRRWRRCCTRREEGDHVADPVDPVRRACRSSVRSGLVCAAGLCPAELRKRSFRKLRAWWVLLSWTSTGAHHYNVYQGTISGGPYLKIGAPPAPPYLDSLGPAAGTTYYYVLCEADASDSESCQSNEANEQFEIIELVPTLSTLGLSALVLAVGWLAVLRLRPDAVA